MSNMLGALVQSRKAWVLLLAIAGVVVMNVAGRVSGEEALSFIKWLTAAWFGAVAVEDAAKKMSGGTTNTVNVISNEKDKETTP